MAAKLLQSIDKIAIGIAALILIAGGVAPLLGGGDSDAVVQMERLTSQLKEKIAGQSLGPPEHEDRTQAIASRYQFAERMEFAPWSFYRAPATLRERVIIEAKPPQHEVSAIRHVRFLRDSKEKRALVQVGGELGKLTHAAYVQAVVERKTREGEWQPIEKIPEPLSGKSFEIVFPNDERAGEFQLRVRAEAKPEAAHAGFQPVQHSVETSLSQPARDLSWEVVNLVKGDVDPDQPDGFRPGQLAVTLHRWDYDTNKEIRISKSYNEPLRREDWKKGDFVCGTRYKLYTIEQEDGKAGSLVAVLWNPDDRNDKVTLKRGQKHLPLQPPDLEMPAPAPESGDAGEPTPASSDLPPPKPTGG